MPSRLLVSPALATLALVGLCAVVALGGRPERADLELAPDMSRFHADVTAYSSSPDETWGDPFITASGRRVADGVVACPRRIPFGTQVRIGSRTYTCWDRLHPKYDDRFDIWKSSKEEALQFGRRRVLVEIL
jgi:3D (Asp-Asp-Asp) domain-containing protein